MTTTNLVSEMAASFRSAMAMPPSRLEEAAEALRGDFQHEGMVTRNSDHLRLLASAYRLARDGAGHEFRDLEKDFLNLGVAFCMKVDTSIKKLLTLLTLVTRFADHEDKEKIQEVLRLDVDPLAQLLKDAATMAPIFGPSLEGMLAYANSLSDHVAAFKGAHGDELESVFSDPGFLPEMVLKGFSLGADLLIRDMLIPTDSASTYPFGWTFRPGFTSHPVVSHLGKLSVLLRSSAVDPDVQERALTNLLGCVVSWCGEMTLTDVAKSVQTPRSNKACNAVIFDMLFTPERLEGAMAICRFKGASVLTDYVFDNHRSLASRLPRSARAKRLEDELGL